MTMTRDVGFWHKADMLTASSTVARCGLPPSWPSAASQCADWRPMRAWPQQRPEILAGRPADPQTSNLGVRVQVRKHANHVLSDGRDRGPGVVGWQAQAKLRVSVLVVACVC